MITLYGIKNCDTVKKARRWLDENRVDYRFHDFRVDGLEAKKVKQWLASSSMDKLINKRSTTWKQLPDSTKENFDEKSAITTAVEQPTLIKRPVLEYDEGLLIGFNAGAYQEQLQ